jgi:hypothetical protein
MSMYFTSETTLGVGAAYIFLHYIVSLLWTLLAAVGFLWKDRGAFRALEEAEGILPPSEPET